MLIIWRFKWSSCLRVTNHKLQSGKIAQVLLHKYLDGGIWV